MKKRIISAFIALLIAIPLLLSGGFVYSLGIYILSLISLREFLKIRETKKELPLFISFISYVIISLFVLTNFYNSGTVFSIDYRIIAGLFLVFTVPAVMYHDRQIYSINDAFYLIGGIFFLGTSFSLLILIRNESLNILIYLLLIGIITDTYAYLTGRLIGKTKLLEAISPNKTLEGLVGGTVFGVFISTVYFETAINSNLSLGIVILMTLFLSILGQYGDLVFSAIKRYFGKKDFSNIMPGHGGILDRLDSTIFIILGYMFFASII